MNIMYIEDDPKIAEIYMTIIKENFLNLNLRWFKNSSEALNELKENFSNYSLIISDFQMPQVTGGEIFRFVNGQMLGIPFIVLSGYDCSTDENFKFFFNSHTRNAFLLKPSSTNELIEKIKWCLADEADILKIYSQSSKNFDEKIPIGTSSFLKLNYVPCDVYVKLSDEKYVKVINKKQLFESRLIQKLVLKGVESLYVNRSEFSQYSEAALHSLLTVVKAKKNILDDSRKSQLTSKSIDFLKSNLLKCGFSEVLMEATDEVIKMQIDLIKSSKSVEKYINNLQLFKKADTDHTRLVSYLVAGILRELSWDSDSTLHRMCLAAMLCDISLPDNFPTMDYSSIDTNTLSAMDKATYLKHPEQSSHVAKHFEAAEHGVDLFILEHHEKPDSSGFPKKLGHNKIHPLSAVLILGEHCADLLWEFDFSVEKVCERLKSERSYYSRGFYRKPYDGLVKMFVNNSLLR